jgi:hypothetical protein
MLRAITAALAFMLSPGAHAAQPSEQASPPPSPGAPSAKGGAAQGGTGGAATQGPTGNAAPKPSPSAERVARELTTQPSWNETIGAYATSLSTQISAALKSQGGDPPQDVEQRVRSGLDKAIGYDEVVRLQAQALAGRFSEDELRTIQKFYESPTGRKLVVELPGVSRQVIDVVQERISAAIPHIVKDVAPSLARGKAGSAEEGTAPGGAPKSSSPNAQGRKPPAQSPGP